MKGSNLKEKKQQQTDVDVSLNTYVGQDIAPKKTEHINSIAEQIKRALAKFRTHPSH